MRLSMIFAVSAVALAGCAVDATNTETTAASSEEALSTFAAPLVGSYHRIDGGIQLAGLTLNANGTYGRDDQVECFAAPCDPIHSTGKWSASGTGFSGTLKLTPKHGAPTTYGVTLVGPLGSLDLKSNGTTLHEERIPATCGGIAGFQFFSGLTCNITATYPDAAGVCQ